MESKIILGRFSIGAVKVEAENKWNVWKPGAERAVWPVKYSKLEICQW